MLDGSLVDRLLAPSPLMRGMSRHLDLRGARLLSATSRPIDAPGYLSDLVGVTLQWSAEAGVPACAVLKVSHPGFGQAELPFYETTARHLNCPVVPAFFAGGVDEPSGRTWVLMEDLSGSHQRPSDAPLPPTFARNAALVEALARFHAAGTQRDHWPDSCPTLWERLRASDWLQAAVDRMLNQAGDALASRTQITYARFLHSFPALVEQVEQLPGRTLVHGDAHVWNWMVPRDDAVGTPKLIDWDGWQLGVGVWDLAYMMALQWDRDVRQRFETPLLDRYHAALIASGLRDRSREQLQQDYRLAVLVHLRTPMARFARGMSPYVWWPQLTRIQQAVEDLECFERLH